MEEKKMTLQNHISKETARESNWHFLLRFCFMNTGNYSIPTTVSILTNSWTFGSLRNIRVHKGSIKTFDEVTVESGTDDMHEVGRPHSHKLFHMIYIKKNIWFPIILQNTARPDCTAALTAKPFCLLKQMFYSFNNIITHLGVFFLHWHLQGRHSDSGMGLSSEDLKKLNHLESLVQPLSIMALA